jgi:hypothetical protein
MLKRLLILAAIILFSRTTGVAQEQETYEQSPFNYSQATPSDGISALQEKISSGKLNCGSNDRDIVRSLLRELHIPTESQVLVFSKTSLQRQRIGPASPRSVFFTDNCYLGWVPSGLVEITTVDPVLGPIFYAFDPSAYRTNSAQCLARSSDCLRCHGGTFVRGIPGVLVRSVYPGADGEPMLQFGTEVVDFRTPFTNRWGGWYVTGLHGSALHRGNSCATERDGQPVMDFRRGANVTDLSPFFRGAEYLTNTSDIVALLVLEHQTAMQNTLTRASLNSRRMLEYQRKLQSELKEPVTEEPVYQSVKSVLDSSAREIVDDLLFKDEAQLPPGIRGGAGFQRAFQANARRAPDGGSLKDLLLDGHLFQNRCSYLIYSDSFLSLPKQLKSRVYRRLAAALRSSSSDSRYAYLDSDERGRLVLILRQTFSEFAELHIR